MEAYYQAPSLCRGKLDFVVLTGGKARTDPQVAYPATTKKAKAAVAASWPRYEEWKKAHSFEVYTETAAIVIERGMSLYSTVVVLNQWH
jgi:hypothetical protein